MIEIEELYENLFWASSDSEFILIDAFIRLQEFYESPHEKICGKTFTLDEFVQIYGQDMGNFTYYTDAIGFNIPGKIVNRFQKKFRGRFALRSNEKTLFSQLRKHKMLSLPDYYLIGTPSTYFDDRLLDHELAHGFYYLDREYRQEMKSLIERIKDPNNIISKITNSLLDSGYSSAVLYDEIQAYLATSSREFLEETLELTVNDDLLTQFHDIFQRYK